MTVYTLMRNLVQQDWFSGLKELVLKTLHLHNVKFTGCAGQTKFNLVPWTKRPHYAKGLELFGFTVCVPIGFGVHLV